MANGNKIVTEEQMMELLDNCYSKSLNGIEKVSPSIEKFAEDSRSNT